MDSKELEQSVWSRSVGLEGGVKLEESDRCVKFSSSTLGEREG